MKKLILLLLVVPIVSYGQYQGSVDVFDEMGNNLGRYSVRYNGGSSYGSDARMAVEEYINYLKSREAEEAAQRRRLSIQERAAKCGISVDSWSGDAGLAFYEGRIIACEQRQYKQKMKAINDARARARGASNSRSSYSSNPSSSYSTKVKENGVTNKMKKETRKYKRKARKETKKNNGYIEASREYKRKNKKKIDKASIKSKEYMKFIDLVNYWGIEDPTRAEFLSKFYNSNGNLPVDSIKPYKNEDKLLIIDIGSQILKTKENQYW